VYNKLYGNINKITIKYPNMLRDKNMEYNLLQDLEKFKDSYLFKKYFMQVQ
jgi:predicted DNA binding CopG/RHH family protein